jgi:hypothetical protein
VIHRRELLSVFVQSLVAPATTFAKIRSPRPLPTKVASMIAIGWPPTLKSSLMFATLSMMLGPRARIHAITGRVDSTSSTGEMN